MCAAVPSCPIYAELGTEAKGLHIPDEHSTRFRTCNLKERFYFRINHISLYLKSKNTFIFYTTPSPIFHTCVSWCVSLGASQSFGSFVSEHAKIQGCEPLWAPSNVVNYIQIPRRRMSHMFPFFSCITWHAWCQRKSEEGTGFSRTRIMEGCELPCRYLGSNPDSLQEQQVF